MINHIKRIYAKWKTRCKHTRYANEHICLECGHDMQKGWL